MSTILGSVLDGSNAVLRPLADETPRPEGIQRVLFENVTLSDPTELVCTLGFSSLVVLVAAVNVNPGVDTEVGLRCYSGPLESDADGVLAENTRHVQANISAAGVWTPGFTLYALPKWVQLGPIDATADLDLLLEFRRTPFFPD